MGWLTEKGKDEKEVCRIQEQRESSTHLEYILETNRGTQRAKVFTRFLKTQIWGARAARSERAIHMNNHVKQWCIKHFLNSKLF